MVAQTGDAQLKSRSSLPKSVVHVITTAGYGGAENHLLDLLECQFEAGMEVHLRVLRITESAGSAWLEEAARWTMSVDCVGDGAMSIPRLHRDLGGIGPDIVHSHLPRADVAVFLANMGRSSAVRIASVHNVERFAGMRLSLAKLGLRWSYATASRTIAISRAVTAYLKELGVPPQTITEIPYGLSQDRRSAAVVSASRRNLRRELGVSDDTVVIGTLARLASQKGLDTLIRAFAGLPAKSHHLAIVGTDEGEGAALHRLARQLSVSHRTHFLGFRRDAPRILEAFDIFCLPTRWEGLGRVFLEAALARVPIVTSRISPITHILGDGCAILCEPDDVHGFGEALTAVLADAGLRERLIHRAYSKVVEEFSQDKMATRIATVYQDAWNSQIA